MLSRLCVSKEIQSVCTSSTQRCQFIHVNIQNGGDKMRELHEKRFGQRNNLYQGTTLVNLRLEWLLGQNPKVNNSQYLSQIISRQPTWPKDKLCRSLLIRKSNPVAITFKPHGVENKKRIIPPTQRVAVIGSRPPTREERKEKGTKNMTEGLKLALLSVRRA